MSDDLRTRLVHASRPPKSSGGQSVNPPLTRLSTVLFESVEEMQKVRQRRDSERLLSYGARGNPTAFALEDLVTELEGGYRSKLFPTGLAAAAQALLSYLRPGDHVLITESVYAPVRRVASELLEPFGIEVGYFAPDGQDLEARLQANTRMVYVEVPGSLLYELCDLPAIAALCRPRGILLAADNTWGSGYLYRPLMLGADISIMALTKYLSGHGDVVMGSLCTREEVWQPLSRMTDALGITVSPDDAWLVLRGARTLAARLEVHERQALEVAYWLQVHPKVGQVYHPALPEHPNHALWQRDFSGSNGLLSFRFSEDDPVRATRVINALRLFGIGASWGGYESLAVLADLSGRGALPTRSRTLVRLHIGLDASADLIADLEQALSYY